MDNNEDCKKKPRKIVVIWSDLYDEELYGVSLEDALRRAGYDERDHLLVDMYIDECDE